MKVIASIVFFSVFFSVFSGSLLFSQPDIVGIELNNIKLKAFVDKSSITIGEEVTYVLQIELKKEYQVDFTRTGRNMGGFEVKSFEQEKDEKMGKFKLRKRRKYVLSTYTVGSYIIPSQTVMVTLLDKTVKVLYTQDLFIEVKSTLDSSDNHGSIKDIKGPVSFPFKLGKGVLMGIVLGFIVVGVMGFFIFRRRQLRCDPIVIKTADEVALIELDRIEALDLIQKNEMKEFYYLVSNCLRMYLENRYSIKAPEQTTEELKDYLYHCDLVKYAKLSPKVSDSQKVMDTTKEFIKKTR